MDTAQDLKPKPKKRTIVIGIIIVLVVTVSVVAVVLLNEAHERDINNRRPPFFPWTKSSYPGGLRFTIVPTSTKTLWGDVRILLQNGSTTDSWSVTTAGLTGIAGVTLNGSAQVIGGGKSVYLNVTDLVGNGYMNGGDYLSLEPSSSFSAASSYTLTLIYVPTGSEITHCTFTG